MRINTIGFQAPYLKIKLVWRVFGAFYIRYDFRAFAVTLIPIHSFVIWSLFVRPSTGSTSRDVMSAQRYCKLVLAVARITTHLANSSRNKILCSSCEMMLQKVESTSTFRNKILICCSYYHTATTCHATNLEIHAFDWLKSVTRQRARAHIEHEKTNKHGGARNESKNKVLFEKELKKNKSLLLLF